MSIYFEPKRGWKYDFKMDGERYTSRYFQTKKEAKRAEAQRKEEIKNPQETPTDMEFFDLGTLWLDHLKAYDTEKHYTDMRYHVKRWVKMWNGLYCSQINQDMVQRFLLKRRRVSAVTANKELRCLRAVFNYGIKKKYITDNPVAGLDSFPVVKKARYVPPQDDIDKVINVAEPEEQDYLWVIRETMGRMSEINQLEWKDVNFVDRYVVLYTRKKRHGDMKGRKVSMTEKLFDVLSKRYMDRDKSKPWVFWHRYWSRKRGAWHDGPYTDRKTLMRRLCEKAGVRYFRYHPLRHAGASLMDNSKVPTGSIQRILGHENRSTTEIYLHSISDAERDAILVYEDARKSHSDSHSKNKEGQARQLDPIVSN
jgi:integrase